MKQLKESFRLNGLLYTLLKRNDVVALYGIGGDYTDEIRHWEVDIIYIRKDQYGEREHIANNENFGIDRSRCFHNELRALEYYDKHNEELLAERNLPQGVSKLTTGEEENTGVIPDIVNVPLRLKTQYLNIRITSS
jgi:hypothetical protein